ncbi:MAG: T9SS type A sorting domain-containing protein [Bacteroidota bacterium]
MRKQLFNLLLIFLFTQSVLANGVVYNRGMITELYFEPVGQWNVELRIEYLHHFDDTAFYLFSLADSARLNFIPDSTGLYLLTQQDFGTTLYINPYGDILYIKSFGDYSSVKVTPNFIYGNMPGASVLAPVFGQSLVGIGWAGQYENYIVKDNVHSPGYETDPQRGTLKGYTYDSLNNVLPYQKIHLYGVENRIIWSDENGYFEDSTLYGCYYEAWIEKDSYVDLFRTDFFIEPGDISNIDFVLPIGSEVTIEGYCYLLNATYHAETYIIFTPECAGSIPDSTMTDSSGFFSINISPGKYNYRFSRNGYLPYNNYFPVYCFENNTLEEQTIENGIVHEIPAGKVGGHWIPDAEYWVMGDIYVDPGDSLILDPGVMMIFKGGWKLDVHGTIIAEGTENDSIFFISGMDGWAKWNSLNFYKDDTSISKITYAHIEKIFNGLRFYNSSPEIKNSRLINTSTLEAYDHSSLLFHDNYCNTYSSPSFVSYDASSPDIYNNYITFGAVRAYDDSHPTIRNNTFYDQWVAISCNDRSCTEITNNIFYQTNVISSNSNECSINIMYNCLWESNPAWWGINIPGYGIDSMLNNNGDSCDIYYNLIEKDPMFADPENDDFHLLPESSCIDAGDPAFPYDPDSTIADIGAFYYDQLNTYVKRPWDISELYEITAIPNPNRGDFTISIESPKPHHYEASLSIYAMNGILQAIKKIAILDKGNNLLPFSDINNIQSGIYFCTLDIDGRIMASTKIIIINN